jgi:hypothetical protein
VFSADGKTLKTKFKEVVGEAFAGYPEAEAQVYDAVKAYIAGAGDSYGSVDDIGISDLEELVSDAVENITGGVAEINDRKVVLPFGVSEEEFISKASKKVEEITGNPAIVDDVNYIPAWQNAYYVELNGGILTKSGKPIVVEFE